MSATKSACPVTRKQFRSGAQPAAATIAGSAVVLEVKEFSTGSLGWFANGKLTVEVGGKRVVCQLNCMLTIVGSKDAQEG